MSDPLTRPIWNSLHAGWTHLAEGDALAIALYEALGFRITWSMDARVLV